METRMPLLSDEEIDERLARLHGWQRAGDAIRKRFDNGDFQSSVAFLNRLTPEAEEMYHHPELEISWGTVNVSITSDLEGGLTEKDFELARRIEAVA